MLTKVLYLFLAVSLLAIGVTLYTKAARDSMANAAEKSAQGNLQKAILAGGCFWCMEPPFEKLDGVISVVSGYIGGRVEDPTYKQVSAGGTGHAEAVEITYDPDKVSYETLLEVFWRQINPSDAGGQFVDRGSQYRSAIFYLNDTQKKLAEASKEKLAASKRFDKPIVTEIVSAGRFYKAEGYHQDYYRENPIRYKLYRYNSGRDQFLDRFWSEEERNYTPPAAKKTSWKNFEKPAGAVLLKKLTPMQFKVTQQEGTEPAFQNEYHNNKRPGIYVDIVSGEPLFSSTDKYDSGTGWPSFSKPLVAENIVEHEDFKLFMKRVEVRSTNADSHLGHVFDDGPAPTNLRYCINSAALRFVPVENLEKEGYAEFLHLFK